MINGNYTKEDKERIGEQLAQIFCLRVVRKNPSLYKTSWGNKYDKGIFEMVQKFGTAIYHGDVEVKIF